jgi:hypothetical protein
MHLIPNAVVTDFKSGFDPWGFFSNFSGVQKRKQKLGSTK